MFDAMSLTDYLALMFGVYLIAAGIGLFQEGKAYAAMLTEFKENAALGYFAGVIVFVMGLVLVRVHNEWGSVVACVVSLVGWVCLAEGVLLLAFRRQFLSLVGCLRLSSSVLAGFALFCFTLGGWLIYTVLM